mmetsp:Transcript_70657/g.183399  ORF Transcript_70657/g.183399 Transcript_70657/m.183399 type:complete len:204 (-) Transcript_70657:505-1116(-)
MRCPAGNRREIRDVASPAGAGISKLLLRLSSWRASLSASCCSMSCCSANFFSSSSLFASRSCSSCKRCSSTLFLSISKASWYSRSCCSRSIRSSACCSVRATISARCVSISSMHSVSMATIASTWMSPDTARITRTSSTDAGKMTAKHGNSRACTIRARRCACCRATSIPHNMKFSLIIDLTKSFPSTFVQTLWLCRADALCK